MREKRKERNTDFTLEGGGIGKARVELEEQEAHLPFIVIDPRFARTFGENKRGIGREKGVLLAKQHAPEKNCAVCVESLSHSISLSFAGIGKEIIVERLGLGKHQYNQTLNNSGFPISSLHAGRICLSFPNVSILPIDHSKHEIPISCGKHVKIVHSDNIHTLAVHFVANIKNERILQFFLQQMDTFSTSIPIESNRRTTPSSVSRSGLFGSSWKNRLQHELAKEWNKSGINVASSIFIRNSRICQDF